MSAALRWWYTERLTKYIFNFRSLILLRHRYYFTYYYYIIEKLLITIFYYFKIKLYEMPTTLSLYCNLQHDLKLDNS